MIGCTNSCTDYNTNYFLVKCNYDIYDAMNITGKTNLRV